MSAPRQPAPVLSCLGFADAEALAHATAEVCRPDTDLLPISTCLRHELYVLGPRLDTISGDATLLGEQSDAAARLFMLAAGGLSDVPGERAVRAQVQAALRAARRQDLCGKQLAALARRALDASDVIRRRVEEDTKIIELPEIVADAVAAHVGRHRDGCGEIVLLGAGALARSLREALRRRDLGIACWATRRPRMHRGGAVSLARAHEAIRRCGVVIAAVAGDAALKGPIGPGVLTIDLGTPGILDQPQWTAATLVAQAHDRLAPQAGAFTRAAHRIPALAEAALAEVLSPSIAPVAEAIARFRESIVAAELERLGPLLERMSAGDAERVRRSIRHAAARCAHPIHEYVNQLGRQGRPDEAACLVDHLLGTRVGFTGKNPSPRPSPRERGEGEGVGDSREP